MLLRINLFQGNLEYTLNTDDLSVSSTVYSLLFYPKIVQVNHVVNRNLDPRLPIYYFLVIIKLVTISYTLLQALSKLPLIVST